MVYVTPTRDMGIQQSHFVDTNGVVYLPYLNEWRVVSKYTETYAYIAACASFKLYSTCMYM